MPFFPATTVFNDSYIAEQYDAYRRDPSSVDESWRGFFRAAESLAGPAAPAGAALAPSTNALRAAAGASALAASIRRFGHLDVPLDPLGSPPQGAPELTPEHYGIDDRDLASIPGSVLGFPDLASATD